MNFEIVDVLVDENYDPQPLVVEEESLGIEKTLNKKPSVVRSGRVSYLGDYADVGEKTSGDVLYEFRAETLLKPLYAHFQCGVVFASSPYKYRLYPLKKPLREFETGVYTVGTYGTEPQKAYQVMVSKKTSDQGFFLFRKGIVDKFSFESVAEETAKARTSFLFTDYDLTQLYFQDPWTPLGVTYRVTEGPYTGLPHPFYVSVIPNGVKYKVDEGEYVGLPHYFEVREVQFGNYSEAPPFNFDSTEIYVDGTSYPLTGFSVTSSNNAQEIKKAGKKNPHRYIFGNHSVTGRMVLDMPDDVVHLVGSMLDKKPFSVSGTMTNDIGESVILRMPVCQRLPFTPTLSDRTFYAPTTIPFEAMATETSPSIEVEITTNYEFTPIVGVHVLEDLTDSAETLYDQTDSNETLEDVV